MATVKEIMNNDIYYIEAKKTVRDLLDLFAEKQVSGVPVVDENNKLVGIITDADVLARIQKQPTLIDVMTYVVILDADAITSGEINKLLDKRVSELMTRKVITVNEDTDLAEVAQILSKRKFKKVPVVNKGKLTGVVSRGDMVRYLMREFLQKNSHAAPELE